MVVFARRMRPRQWHQAMNGEPDSADTSWMQHGNCYQLGRAVTTMMFPERGAMSSEARQFCVGCPVAEPCLWYAIDHRINYGIWGGLGLRERKRIRRTKP